MLVMLTNMLTNMCFVCRFLRDNDVMRVAHDARCDERGLRPRARSNRDFREDAKEQRHGAKGVCPLMLIPGFIMGEDVTVDSMHGVKVMAKDHIFKLCKGKRMPVAPKRPNPIKPPKNRRETPAAAKKRAATSKLRIDRFEHHLKLHQRLAAEHKRFKLTPAHGAALDVQYRQSTSPPQTFNRSNAPFRLTGNMKCADWLAVLLTEAMPVLLHTRIEDSAFQAIDSWLPALKKLVTIEYIRDEAHMVCSRMLCAHRSLASMILTNLLIG
jgi:hypothetical protein